MRIVFKIMIYWACSNDILKRFISNKGYKCLFYDRRRVLNNQKWKINTLEHKNNVLSKYFLCSEIFISELFAQIEEWNFISTIKVRIFLSKESEQVCIRSSLIKLQEEGLFPLTRLTFSLLTWSSKVRSFCEKHLTSHIM